MMLRNHEMDGILPRIAVAFDSDALKRICRLACTMVVLSPSCCAPLRLEGPLIPEHPTFK